MLGKSHVVSIIMVLSSCCSALAEVAITVSYEYADLSGVRAYKASGNLNDSNMSSQDVPRIGLRGSCCKYLEFGLSYAYIDNLRGNGVAGSSDIFNESGMANAVITPYGISEDIHDLTVFGGLNIDLSENASFSIGPEVHYFTSRAKVAYRTFHSEDWRIGVYGTLNYRLGDHFFVQGSYRYVKPPEREIHFFGIGLGYGF